MKKLSLNKKTTTELNSVVAQKKKNIMRKVNNIYFIYVFMR